MITPNLNHRSRYRKADQNLTHRSKTQRPGYGTAVKKILFIHANKWSVGTVQPWITTAKSTSYSLDLSPEKDLSCQWIATMHIPMSISNYISIFQIQKMRLPFMCSQPGSSLPGPLSVVPAPVEDDMIWDELRCWPTEQKVVTSTPCTAKLALCARPLTAQLWKWRKAWITLSAPLQCGSILSSPQLHTPKGVFQRWSVLSNRFTSCPARSALHSFKTAPGKK